MLNKQQVLLGSPKNVTVNILNGNNFFTLDYESQNNHEQMNRTMNNFLGDNHSAQLKEKSILKNGTPNFKVNNSVKSAQYSRKLQSNLAYRMSINPYIRIKKVQELIQQKKQRKSQIQANQKNKSSELHSILLPIVAECKTERINRSEEKEKFVKSLSIDPEISENINNIASLKKISKTLNAFAENYKNRRKLLDRVSQKRNYGRISPLRWGSKPQDLLQKQEKKYWSPYKGKLFNREKDPLLSSIQGNKIKYNHHQPKYFKGKIQQINAI